MDGDERSGAIALSYKPWQTGAFGARAADILDLTARRSLSPLRASKEPCRKHRSQVTNGRYARVRFAAILYKF